MSNKPHDGGGLLLVTILLSLLVLGKATFELEDELELERWLETRKLDLDDQQLRESKDPLVWFHREIGFTPSHITNFQSPCSEYDNEECARRFLTEYDRVKSRNKYVIGCKLHDKNLDMKNVTKRKVSEKILFQALHVGNFMKTEAMKFKFHDFTYSVKRQFKFITQGGPTKDEDLEKRQVQLKNKLLATYSKARTCPKGMPCLGVGELPMTEFMLKEHDYDRLAAAWKAWNDIQGKNLKPIYTEFVKTANANSQQHGFKNAGYQEWFLDMEDPNFDSYVWEVLNEIKPLYQELHAYVRARLRQHYPNRFAADDPIPAHLLGNVWAQQWQNIFPLVKPYEDIPSAPNISQAMQSVPVKKMVHLADKFYASMGLPPMTEDFWKYSVLTKIPGRVMDCHPAARDLSNGVDFRMTMCGTKSTYTFGAIHHEMGHIQYYMHYSPLPVPFRSGANTGFHEAVGDTMAMSAVTPAHLRRIGLVGEAPVSYEYDINCLMEMALEKVVFFPFGLLVDVWRWRVFNGTIPEEHYNREWWKMRMELQGVMPPEKRDESTADALFKYHVAANVPYIRYFTSFVMQFQFYEALCDASGHEGLLHRCDFFNSKEAGEKLSSMLRIGSSRPWQDSMEAITGQRKLSTRSILRYFQPLHDWLKKENKRLNVPVGWKVRDDLIG